MSSSRTHRPGEASRLYTAGLCTATTAAPIVGLGALMGLPATPVVLTIAALTVTLYQAIAALHDARGAVVRVQALKALPAAPAEDGEGEGDR